MSTESAWTREVVSIGRLILVAEDSACLRKAAERFLRKAGYQTIEARNGAEAVRTFAQHHDEIQLVLLDVMMPKLNGHQACAAIRRINAHVPIVFCSGHAEESLANRMPANSRFIAKPYRREELLRVVDQTLAAVAS